MVDGGKGLVAVRARKGSNLSQKQWGAGSTSVRPSAWASARASRRASRKRLGECVHMVDVVVYCISKRTGEDSKARGRTWPTNKHAHKGIRQGEASTLIKQKVYNRDIHDL